MQTLKPLAILLLLGFAHSALAGSDTWIETGDGRWNRPGNWAEGSVPGAISVSGNGDAATFNTSAEVPITVDATRGLKSLRFDTEAGSFQFTDGHLYFQSGGGIDLLSTITSTGRLKLPHSEQTQQMGEAGFRTGSSMPGNTGCD